MKESPEHVYEAAPLYMATSPWLNKFNLAVNERLRLFSCSVCMQLYHAKNVAEHLRSAHGVRLDSKVRTALDKVIDNQGIEDTYPVVIPTQDMVYDQFGGVRMDQEFGCPACPVAGTEGYIKRHIRSDHKADNLEPQANVYTQCFNRAVTKTKLRVRPATMDMGEEVYMDDDNDGAVGEWKKKFAEAVNMVMEKTRAPANARYVSPWLMRTQWHTLTEGQDPQPLCDLVSMPKPDGDLAWVKPLVLEYMLAASDLIKGTSRQTLQKLNSSNPDHE